MDITPQPSLELSFAQAARSFRRFFDELRLAFVEREALITQVEMALLSREHVLILGPPGTAKSALADAVVNRIVDAREKRPSVFAKQLAENTVQTDLIGPVDFKVLTETGRTEHLTDEGMLGATHAFIDEVFDGRDMLLRSILNVLHERELKHGTKITAGLCETAIMTSNRYLSEVMERSPESLQAFADRVSFVGFAPKAFARAGSRAAMLRRSLEGQRPILREVLTLEELHVLKRAVTAVDVPADVSEALEALCDDIERRVAEQARKTPDYRPTKFFSQRTLVKAMWALRAVVVRDRIFVRRDRPLVAELSDLSSLLSFFTLGGPSGAELEQLVKGAVDPRERAQLELMRLEQTIFQQSLVAVRPQAAQAAAKEASAFATADEKYALDALKREWAVPVATTLVAQLRAKLFPGPRYPENRARLIDAARGLSVVLEQELVKALPLSEPRTLVGHLTALSSALVLVKEVPELKDALPRLAAPTALFIDQVLKSTPLLMEQLRFAPKVTPEQVAERAEQVSTVFSLVQQLDDVQPGGSERQRTFDDVSARTVSEAIEATLAAIPNVARDAGSPRQVLERAAEHVRTIEARLRSIHASAEGIQARALRGLVMEYAKHAIDAADRSSIVTFERDVHRMLEIAPRGSELWRTVVELARTPVSLFLERALGMVQPPKQLAVDETLALSGDLYVLYREHLGGGAATPVSELMALNALEPLMDAAHGDLVARVREVLLRNQAQWLLARVTFLKSWLGAVASALAKARGQSRFEELIRSRFPQIVTREGELVRIDGELGVLVESGGAGAQSLGAIRNQLEDVAADFAQLSKQILAKPERAV